MAILKTKVQGFTLAEAVVSMIIIMACFSLSTMIYLNIIKSDNVSSKTKAFLEGNKVATETFQNHEFFDQDYELEEMTISRRIESYRNNDKLKLVLISVRNKEGKVLYSYKQITTKQ